MNVLVHVYKVSLCFTCRACPKSCTTQVASLIKVSLHTLLIYGEFLWFQHAPETIFNPALNYLRQYLKTVSFLSLLFRQWSNMIVKINTY